MCVTNTEQLTDGEKKILQACAEKNVQVKAGLERGASLVNIIQAVIIQQALERKALLRFAKNGPKNDCY